MANNPTTGVVGIDGVEPVYEPDARFTTWALQEVYLGQNGAGKYVPKVNDLVVDRDVYKWYKCISIDQSTLVPHLIDAKAPGQNDTLTDLDQFLGVGPGTVTDTFRAYLNKNVQPHSLTVEQRIYIKGSRSETAKIFRGSDASGNAKVISQIYNQNNEVIGNSIRLELASIDGQNIATKSVPTCYTMEDMPNDEIVTLVAYADDGQVVAKCQLLVENTQFVPNADASTKYVVGISLESPFLSQADPSVISFPVNMPLVGLSLIGVVHYSDGSASRMPVDGNRFSIFGFNGFVATQVGQTIPLVLKYLLANNEVAYGVSTTPDRGLVRNYKAITSNRDGMYSPKLFGYPVWIDPINGYRMEWFLYDLDRNLSILATPYVTFTSNSPAFNPTLYGYKQSVIAQVNLKDVNVSSRNIQHVQPIDIILRQQGNARTTNWAIGFDPGQDIFFGDNNNHVASTYVNDNLTKVDITSGETTLEAWLQRMYWLTKPLHDPSRETAAPTPTYFSVGTRDWEVAYPIAQWNQQLTLGHAVANNSTLFIKFFVRTADSDVQLAMAGVPVWQVN